MFDPLDIRSLALDHHGADVALRSRVALDADGVRAALADPGRPHGPALILATCNRLELHWIGDERTADWWRARLGDEAAARLKARRGRTSVRHLVRVAAGLESQLLGEAEILGQLRTAFALAREAGTTSPLLTLLVERALAGARRVRGETLLATHAHSVSSAAVHAAAQQAGGSLRGHRVLVLGAGEAARAVLQELPAFEPARITLVNRHPGRAQAAAARFGIADVRPWEQLETALAESDVIFCATAARSPVLTAGLVAALPPLARVRRIVDLAMPSNVAATVRELPGVTVADLDDLRTTHCPELQVGSVQLLAAEALVEREVRRIGAALKAHARTRAIGELHALGAQLAAEETAKTIAALGDGLGDAEREAVALLATRVAKRVLHPVSRLLREGTVERDAARRTLGAGDAAARSVLVD